MNIKKKCKDNVKKQEFSKEEENNIILECENNEIQKKIEHSIEDHNNMKKKINVQNNEIVVLKKEVLEYEKYLVI